MSVLFPFFREIPSKLLSLAINRDKFMLFTRFKYSILFTSQMIDSNNEFDRVFNSDNWFALQFRLTKFVFFVIL